MEDRHFKAFTVIASFVDDLHSVFGKGKTPLDLYHRLSEHIKAKDAKAISRAVLPFEHFVKKYRQIIESGDLTKLPRGTKIPYEGSDRVYIEIEKFIFRGDANVRSSIHRHLLAISAVLTPDEKILQEFENKMSEDTPEAQMINDVVGKLENSLGNSECDNPMAALGQVLNGGLVGELFASMQQGLGSGELDVQRLVGTLQTTLGALAKGSAKEPLPERPRLEDITNKEVTAFGCRSPESKGAGQWDGAFVWGKIGNKQSGAILDNGKDYIGDNMTYEEGVKKYREFRAKGWAPMTREDISESSNLQNVTVVDDAELMGDIEGSSTDSHKDAPIEPKKESDSVESPDNID